MIQYVCGFVATWLFHSFIRRDAASCRRSRGGMLEPAEKVLPNFVLLFYLKITLVTN
jgi:hypothetical protein